MEIFRKTFESARQLVDTVRLRNSHEAEVDRVVREANRTGLRPDPIGQNAVLKTCQTYGSYHQITDVCGTPQPTIDRYFKNVFSGQKF